MQLNNLEKSILATIVYYNTLEIPLTSFEIWKYLINLKRYGFDLGQYPQLIDVLKILDDNSLKDFIKEKNGFYFLKNREELVNERIRRQKRTIQKMKKFKKYLKFFSALPHIQMIGLTGSISLENLDNKSDWDIFFVIKKNRLYFTAFLIAFFVILFGKRRTQVRTKDKICLNHFISDKNFKINYFSLYDAQIFQRMRLVYDRDKYYIKFKKENNNWVSRYFINGFEKQKPFIKLPKISNFIKNLIEKIFKGKIGDFFEYLAKAIIQRRIIKSSQKYNLPGRIIIDNEQIEYHPASPRFKIINAYNEQMISLGFRELIEKNEERG